MCLAHQKKIVKKSASQLKHCATETAIKQLISKQKQQILLLKYLRLVY